MKFDKIKLYIYSLLLLIADQVSKIIVVSKIPRSDIGVYSPDAIINVIGEDFLRFIHVRNPGALFSLGADSSSIVKLILFKIVGVLIMAYIGWMIWNSKKEGFSKFQTWLLATLLGGGLGNLVDRIFRPEGVVDWIDVKFYGLFGMERWPTFNISDSLMICAVILLFISLAINMIKKNKAKRAKAGK